MTRQLVTATLIGLFAISTASEVFADEGTANQAAGRRVTPIWTFVGIGAGFGTGVWAGLMAFDDAINSDRKVWTCAIVGAAAGGVLGYLVDRHRAKSGSTPGRRRSLITSGEERQIVSASRGLGDGQLRRWLETESPTAAISSIP
jgi:hypothetical protein